MAPSPHTKPLAQRQLSVKQHGVLTPQEWASVIVAEARSLGYKMTPREVAEGLGVLSSEDMWDTSAMSQGAGGHIGGWAEAPSFGSVSERLNPEASTRAALRNWKENGKSWWTAWGQYETGEEGGAGPTRWRKYLPIAEAALNGKSAVAVAATPQASPGGSGGLGGDLMHFALVAVLVLGGIGLIGFGGTRLAGSSAAGKAVES